MKRSSIVRVAGAAATVFLSGLAFGQADWTLRSPAHVPPARRQPAMAPFRTGDLVVMFGGTSSANGVLGDTWTWDGTDWTQVTSLGPSNTGARPPARFAASMAFDPNTGRAVMFGGRNGAGLLGDTWVFREVRTFVVNPVTHFLTQVFFDEWDAVPPPAGTPGPSVRADANMAYDPVSKTIILSGGFGSNGEGLTHLNDTWSFNPSTSTWTQVNAANPPTPGRQDAAMSTCAATGSTGTVPGPLLLFGGATNTSPLGDTWVFQPTAALMTWSGPVVGLASQPQARDGHSMAYYPQSGKTVLYGGEGTPSGCFINPQLGARDFSDTWNGSCTPAAWAQASPAHNPGRRSFYGMSTGPNGFTVVLFGGGKETVFNPCSAQVADSSETWTWGRRVACSPVDQSSIPAGSEVLCQFDPAAGIQFGGWIATGLGPPFRDQLTQIFHAEAPGAASITAQWTDDTGSHSQTFQYNIVHPGQ
jgi:hypothetical protein